MSEGYVMRWIMRLMAISSGEIDSIFLADAELLFGCPWTKGAGTGLLCKVIMLMSPSRHASTSVSVVGGLWYMYRASTARIVTQ